jgi:hypothetical protein
VRGPLPTRVQHPLALTLPKLSPRRARVQAEGTLGVGADLSYSSIFERSQRNGDAVDFDHELLRAAARTRYGFAPGFDVEVELGGVYGSGGFLDAFIESFHSLIGAPNQGRDDAPRDRFAAALDAGGSTVYRFEEDRAQLADTMVVVTWGEEEVAPKQWANAWRLGLDLPTGDESAGAGSGGLDWIVGWSAEYSAGALSHFAGASYGQAQAADSFERADVELPDRYALFYGLEWRWDDRFSWVAQLDLDSALVREIELQEIDRPILDFGVGFVRDVGAASRFWLSFHEDLLADSGPDFALYAGWTWGR